MMETSLPTTVAAMTLAMALILILASATTTTVAAVKNPAAGVVHSLPMKIDMRRNTNMQQHEHGQHQPTPTTTKRRFITTFIKMSTITTRRTSRTFCQQKYHSNHYQQERMNPSHHHDHHHHLHCQFWLLQFRNPCRTKTYNTIVSCRMSTDGWNNHNDNDKDNNSKWNSNKINKNNYDDDGGQQDCNKGLTTHHNQQQNQNQESQKQQFGLNVNDGRNSDISLTSLSLLSSSLSTFTSTLSSKLLLFQYLKEWFQGDFDNYNQVINDYNNGYINTHSGGKHEHIHCTIVPITETTRLSAFYFDGIPTNIFRFRYYQLIPRFIEIKEQSSPSIEPPTSVATTTTATIQTNSSTNSNSTYTNEIVTQARRTNTSTKFVVDTALYTLDKQLEQQLRACSHDPTLWPNIFHSYNTRNYDNSTTTSTTTTATNHNVTTTTPTANKITNTTTSVSAYDLDDLDDLDDHNVNDMLLYIQNDPRIKLLPKCDVRWSFELDPVLHSYAIEYESRKCQQERQQQEQNNHQSSTNTNHNNNYTNVTGTGIHAVMVYGEAIVDSQMIPGIQILIKDQLSLWENELWIHDRGYDPNTGEYIYGNQRSIPYQMERVSSFVVAQQQQHQTNKSNSDNENNKNNNTDSITVHSSSTSTSSLLLVSERHVTNEELAWTMGPQYYNISRNNNNIHDKNDSSTTKNENAMEVFHENKMKPMGGRTSSFTRKVQIPVVVVDE